MRLLLDTNVLIAAFISRGVCSELVEDCLVNHTVCVSESIMEEFSHALADKFGFTAESVQRAVRFLEGNCEIITHGPLETPVCRDPDDDHVLAAAVAGSVECIVSGDQDLLVLERFEGVPIIKPADFWKFEKEDDAKNQ